MDVRKAWQLICSVSRKGMVTSMIFECSLPQKLTIFLTVVKHVLSHLLGTRSDWSIVHHTILKTRVI